MSVNAYLNRLAGQAIIRDTEKLSIDRSIATLEARLASYFPGQYTNNFVFGSYSRGTILPRNMDERSDIDYMIVFSDTTSRPQTHLTRLKRFAEQRYGQSEIFQSTPTVVLSLNHIKFELVPAINTYWNGLQIPAKASDYQDWISTDPHDFNQSLVSANQRNQSLIKPLVRLVKYWNACNRYPFESYDLEQRVVNHFSGLAGFLGLAGRQLKDLFYDFMESFCDQWMLVQYKRNALDRASRLITEAKNDERQGYQAIATDRIRTLLPE